VARYYPAEVAHYTEIAEKARIHTFRHGPLPLELAVLLEGVVATIANEAFARSPEPLSFDILFDKMLCKVLYWARWAMAGEEPRGCGQRETGAAPHGNAAGPGRSRHVSGGLDAAGAGGRAGAAAGPSSPPPASRQPGPGPDDGALTPGGREGDPWGQKAVLDELMARFGSGRDLDWPGDSSALDDGDGLFPDGERASGWPRDSAPWPAAGNGPPPAGTGTGPVPVAVPETMDAGFLPRGTATPGQRGSGSGFASGEVLDTARPGPALAGFADAAAGQDRDYAGLNDDELVGVLAGWQKTESWAAAGRLSAAAELIRRRPGDAGTRTGAGGPLTVWGRFCGDELAAALAISGRAAEQMLEVAHDLAARLPRTARALREGRIDAFKAQIIAEATRVLDAPGAAAAETAVIPIISGKSPGQVRAAIGRAVLRTDPDAARARRERAQRDARVQLWREITGTAALCGSGLPPEEALAADQLISDRARQLKAAGLAGTMNQLRARAYLDVLLGQDSTPVPVGPGGQDRPARSGTSAQPDAGGPASHRPVGAAAGEGPAGRNGADAGTGRNGADAGNGRNGADAGNGADPVGPGGGGHQPGPGIPARTGLAAQINLTIPLVTMLGLAEHPGEAAGFGPVDPNPGANTSDCYRSQERADPARAAHPPRPDLPPPYPWAEMPGAQQTGWCWE
jgi:hypothetical protein